MSNRGKSPDLHLEHLLSRRTKEALIEICRSLNIKGISNLRKSKLVSLLVRRIPEIVEEKMQLWDQPVYDLVKQICTSSPIHYLEPEEELLPEDYLLGECIAFHGEDSRGEYVVIPQEIKQLFLSLDSAAYQEKIRRNTQILRLSKGLLHFYGCLSFDALTEAINHFLPEPVESFVVCPILWETGLYNWDITSERGYFCDGRLTDLDYLLSELKMRTSLEYKRLAYSEVWQAGDPHYFHDQAREIQELVSFLEQRGLNEFTPYFLDLLYGLVQTELSPPEVVFALIEHLDVMAEGDITELALLIFEFYHQVPHWVLKGHSPEEIMDHAPRHLSVSPPLSQGQRGIVYDFATGKRMDENSPCPCGSGQKFKDCCGTKMISS